MNGALPIACESCIGVRPRWPDRLAGNPCRRRDHAPCVHDTYRSRASLEIQSLNESYLDLRDVYPAASPAGDNVVYIQTQVEMLQQDNLFEQVGRKLNLENLPEYRSPRGLVARLREDVPILPIKNSRIVQIICDARSASLAANIANTLAETFIDQNIRMRQDAARQTYQSLLPQLAELRSALRSSPEVADQGSATAERMSTATCMRRCYRRRITPGWPLA